MVNWAELKEGYYWAKDGERMYFNLIINLHGKSPFFRIRAWDTWKDVIIENFEPSKIIEVSKIERPES